MKQGKFLCQNQGEDYWENDDINSKNDESLYKYYYEFDRTEILYRDDHQIGVKMDEFKEFAMKNPGCTFSRNDSDKYIIVGIVNTYPLSLDIMEVDEDYQSYSPGYAGSPLYARNNSDKYVYVKVNVRVNGI